ncbi:MAG: S8 family serine peptidase [Arenicella sp.]|nr:S8 family serine peptidase [Arenicella sp.]
MVGSVVKELTSSAVKQWHTNIYSLRGIRGDDHRLMYTRHDAVEYEPSMVHLNDALDDFSRGTFLARNGVRVVNLSLGTDYALSTPCDNSSVINDDSDLRNIRESIDRLNRQGVSVVTSTRNEGDTEMSDNHVMSFPACLSGTIAVAAVDNSNIVRGALSTHTDFVHDGNGQITGTGITDFGTSFATPRVTAYLAELQTINPTLSQNQVLNIIRQTADRFFSSRKYGTKTINWQLFYPNFQRAKTATIDSFWNIFLNVPANENNLNGAFGWRYGTSEHENGALSTFETIGTNSSDEPFSIANLNSNAEQVMRYSFKLYDIDTPDELEILVNDKSYGFAKTTSSDSLSATRTICIDNADLKPLGERNEIKLSLKSSGETWGVTDIQVERGLVDNTCRKSLGSFPPLPQNPDRLAGSAQPVGNGYQLAKVSELPLIFNVNNNILPTPSTYTSNSLKRDIRVKFTTRSGNTSATDNGTQVLLNNSIKLTTPFFASDDERSYELIISRNDLASGNNVIEFRPRDNSSNALWGIRGISIEYIESVSLSIGATNPSLYGSGQSPTRFTGLRANFNLDAVTNDHKLDVRGWDINSSDEIQVFLNGASLGFLDVSANQNFNFGTNFIFSKAMLKTGINQIEFIQKAASDQWAVKDLLISTLKPDLEFGHIKIGDGLLLEPTQPFLLSTRISNTGAGSSGNSTIRYYLSTDENINSLDTLLGTRPLSAIASNTTILISNSLQTSFVNQGYFIGACVDSVPNELNRTNNCSRAVKLKDSVAGIVPVIMLLLDE